jgi:hypothetical protein
MAFLVIAHPSSAIALTSALAAAERNSASSESTCSRLFRGAGRLCLRQSKAVREHSPPSSVRQRSSRGEAAHAGRVLGFAGSLAGFREPAAR